MMEADCGGEGEASSPIKSGKDGQQFGSTSQGVLTASSSSSSTTGVGGGVESWLVGYGFFLTNAVNEDNKIEPSIPNCGNVSEDDDEATEGVVQNTLTELVGVPVPEQYYHVAVENQGLEGIQDSTNDDERQGSDINFLGEPPPPLVDFEGCRSPCSSQGTSSSIRNLFNEREGIEERACKLKTILEAGCPGVSEKVHQMIKGHLSDKHGTKRFLSHFIKDVMCTSFYKGVCQPDSVEAEKLEKELENLAVKDKNKLLGMIGKELLEKYCATLEPGESQDFFSQEMDALVIDNNSIAVNNLDAIQVEAGQFHQQNFESVKTLELEVKSSLLNDVPVVPDYIPAAGVEEPSTSKMLRKQLTAKKVRVSDENIWDAANDARKEYANAKDKSRQVEKIGIIFYEDIFTEKEKLTCTVSGKNKTDKFDRIKLSFIRAAIAFILGDPVRRNTKAFEKARKETGFVDLTEEQYSLFKKRVLTEHAYRQRKKSVT